MWVAIQFIINGKKSSDKIEISPVEYITGNYNSKTDEFIDDRNKTFHLISDYFNYNNNKEQLFFAFPVLLSDLEKSSKVRINNEELSAQYLCDLCDYIFFIKKGLDNKILFTDYSNQRQKLYLMDSYKDYKSAFFFSEEYIENDFEKEQNEISFDPENVLSILKKRVIAQDEAATKLVNTIYMNLKYSDYPGIKSNILMAGPPGTGKTELIRSLSEILDIPMVVEDITKYTSSGYVGNNVVSMIEDLYLASGKNLKKTETGIIVIDEADKMCSKKNEMSTIRKNDVQEELLGLLDGNVYKFKGMDINTKNITFILIGAFARITDKRIDKKMSLGFESKTNVYTNEINTDELYDFGMNAELLRRVPVRIFTNELSKDDLKRILTESSISNLKVFEKALKLKDNTKLVYTDDTLDAIIENAQKFKGGASGLKNAVTNTLTPAVISLHKYNIDDNKEIFITRETVDDPENFKVKVKRNLKRGKINNELSEANG